MLKVIQVLSFGFFISAFASVHDSGAAERALTKGEKAVIETAIKDKLKDPDSAKFKWLPLNDAAMTTEGDEKGVPYCGLVNSKNSYGGYVGFVPFLAYLAIKNGNPRIAVVVAMGGSETETQTTVTVCKQQGYSF